MVVNRSKVPLHDNIHGGRLVLAIKDEGTERQVWKERFILQGYCDKIKNSIVHDTAKEEKKYNRVLISLATCFYFYEI